MEAIKKTIILEMDAVTRILYDEGLTDTERRTYAMELEALAKAYAALEGKNVTL